MMNSIQKYRDAAELSDAAAQVIVDTVRECLLRQDRFTMLLSGGSTPKQLYRKLASLPLIEKIPWKSVHVFFGDERVVPFDDDRNNGKMAKENLLDHVGIPSSQVHYINTEINPEASASSYERILHEYFDSTTTSFDLSLMGMGDDGHTLSLFPGSPLVHEKKRWTVYVDEKVQNMSRISLTAPIINRSAKTIFLVSGSSKAPALKNVVKGDYLPDVYPAQAIRPINKELYWFVDGDAAREL